MTRNERLLKLGNAIRAFRGSKFTNGKWCRPPQKMAKDRILRWSFRCWRKRDISENERMAIEKAVV